MPTKLVLYRWMCDLCPQMHDSEPECVLHERQQHNPATEHNVLSDDFDSLLLNINYQIENSQSCSSYDQLFKYKHLCEAILHKIVTEMQKSILTPFDDLRKSVKPRPALDESLITTERKIYRSMIEKHENKMSEEGKICANKEQIEQMLESVELRDESSANLDKQLSCEQCGKTFFNHTNLINHRRHVHENVREYHCDYCSKSFQYLHTLTRHRYMHTNERPYKCEHCAHGFTEKAKLKRHCEMHVRNAAKRVRTLSTKHDAESYDVSTTRNSDT